MVFGPDKDALLALPAGVVVPVQRTVRVIRRLLGPKDLSPVTAPVPGQIHAARNIQKGRTVAEAAGRHPQVVVHLFLINHVRTTAQGKTEIGELPIHLVILVIAVAAGIIHRIHPGQMRPELARVVELQVVLGIIVRLVGIVADIPVVVVIFPRPVVATVFVILFQVYPVPGDTAPLCAQ